MTEIYVRVRGFEFAKSNQAKCQICGRKINKDEPKCYGIHSKYETHFSICYKCSPEILEQDIERASVEVKELIQSLKKAKRDLAKGIKKSSKIIIISELQQAEDERKNDR